MFKRLLSNNFVRGSAIFTTASFGVNLINYLFNLVVARGFSLADYGEYLSAMSYVVMFGIPFGAFIVILVKKIGAKDPEHRQTYVAYLERWMFEQLKKYAPLIILAVLAVYVGMLWKTNLQPLSVTFVLFVSTAIFIQMFYFAVLQAYKAFLIHGGLLAGIAIVKLIGGGTVSFFYPALVALYAILFIANAIGAVAGHFLIDSKQIKGELSFTFNKASSYIKKRSTLVPLFTTFGIIGLSNVDIMLVKKFMAPEQVGLYGALSLLAKVILYFVTPITAVAYTFFTGKESQHQSVPIIGLVSILYLLIGGASVVMYSAFPNFIVANFFGQKFLSIAPILWLGAVFGALYSIATFISHYYMAHLSKIGLLSLGALIAQVILLYFFHSDLKTVMTVNIAVVGCLLVPYLGLLFTKLSDNQRLHSNTSNLPGKK